MADNVANGAVAASASRPVDLDSDSSDEESIAGLSITWVWAGTLILIVFLAAVLFGVWYMMAALNGGSPFDFFLPTR